MRSRLLPTAADGPDCGLLMPKVIVSLVTPLVVPLHRAESTVPSARVAGALESAESPRPHADVVVNARARMATTGIAPRRNCIEGFLSTVMGCARVRDLGLRRRRRLGTRVLDLRHARARRDAAGVRLRFGDPTWSSLRCRWSTRCGGDRRR